MKRLLFFLSVIILIPLQAIAAQPEITAESKITAVTVYPDRAMVTRKASVKLGKGDYRVVFPDLPGEALEDSIRVGGQGTAKAKIGSVDTKKSYLEATGKEEVRKLQDEIQGLQDEDRRLADELVLAAKQREFYQAIQFHNAEVWSKDITMGKPTVDDWTKVVSFLQGGQRDAVSQAQGLDIKRRELKNKIEALKKRLAEMQSAGGKQQLSASVDVSSPADGTFDFELGYMVMGAYWAPSYDIKAEVDAGRVSIRYMGQVSQRTSEDWNGVALSMSTSRPGVGAAPPELYPWYVRLEEPIYYQSKQDAFRQAPMMKQGAMFEGAPAPVQMPMEEAEVSTSEAVTSGTSVLFTAAGPQDIRADGTVTKAVISEELFKSEFDYFTVPKLAPYAYLRGIIINDKDYPLLPGQAGVFVGRDYLGKSQVTLTAPGEKVFLPLGIDEGVKVKRDLVRKNEEDTGVISKTRRITYAYRITVESFKKTAQTVTVLDQLPVSQQEEVTVKEIRIDPPPVSKDEKGFVKWKLPVAPGEKKEFNLEFYIEFPRDRNIPGI